MPNRFIAKNNRVYAEGVDLSGYARSLGEIGGAWEEAEGVALTDAVKGVELGNLIVSPVVINSNMDNTTGGLHDKFVGNDDNPVDLLIAMGGEAAPVVGSPTWALMGRQSRYAASEIAGGSMVAVNYQVSGWDARASILLYDNLWGELLHINEAETAVNSATGQDGVAQSVKGGWAQYHLLTSNGTVTLKVQDASTNSDGSFSDLVSSGSLDASSAPKSASIALAKGATVERYTRWQLAFGTATTATFLISFMRANR